jgi:hypothetical protein
MKKWNQIIITDNWIEKSIKCVMCKEEDTVKYDPYRWQQYTGGRMVQNVWPEAPATYREKLIGLRSGHYVCNTCWPELGEE